MRALCRTCSSNRQYMQAIGEHPPYIGQVCSIAACRFSTVRRNALPDRALPAVCIDIRLSVCAPHRAEGSRRSGLKARLCQLPAWQSPCAKSKYGIDQRRSKRPALVFIMPDLRRSAARGGSAGLVLVGDQGGVVHALLVEQRVYELGGVLDADSTVISTPMRVTVLLLRWRKRSERSTRSMFCSA